MGQRLILQNTPTYKIVSTKFPSEILHRLIEFTVSKPEAHTYYTRLNTRNRTSNHRPISCTQVFSYFYKAKPSNHLLRSKGSNLQSNHEDKFHNLLAISPAFCK